MAKIATCPKCAAQLALSDELALNDRLECPECKADFLLGETIQIALPVARMIPQEEAAPTIESAEAVEEAAAEPALSSWKDRLKDAIVSETVEGEQEPSSSDKQKEPQQTVPLSPPSFELDLDLETPSEAEPVDSGVELELPKKNPLLDGISRPLPKSEPRQASPPTLADFAAKAEPKPVELELPEVNIEGVDQLLEKTQTVAEQAVEKPKKKVPTKIPAKVSPAKPKTLDAEQISDPATTEQREITKRGFPKVAAFAVGPIAGSLLGLYGLLWLQGPRADHVGMSHVLPQSMLPAEFNGEATPVKEESSMAAARELMQQPVPMKRDAAVQPATAYQALPSRTTLKEFNASFASAKIATPEFLTGDLSEPDSVRRKGQAYMSLCQLAEHFDFANQPGLAPMVLSNIEEAKQLYQRVSRDAAAREQLSHIASRWWEYDQRSNQGIFLTGTIESIEPIGDGKLCNVTLSSSMTVPVLFQDTPFNIGDSIGVVGQVAAGPVAGPKKVVTAAYSYSLK